MAYNSVVVSSSSRQTTTFATTPTALNFTAVPGSASASPQTVSLSSNPAGISWTASSNVPWLTLSAAQGTTTPASVTVSATAASLTAGTYKGVLTFTPSTGSAVQVGVTLTVTAPSPMLVVTPTSGSLQAYTGQAIPAFSAAVQNQSGALFNWTATSNQSWLSVAPSSGSGSGTFTANPSATLTPGTYTATITVAAPGLPNSPVLIPITLTVSTATLSDNFSNNALGWIISPNGLGASFSVANHAYSYNGGGNTQSCSGSATYADYEFDFGLQLLSGSDYPGGVRARVNPATGAGYGLWFYPSEGVVKLLNIPTWSVNGSTTVIAQAAVKLDMLSHNYRLVLTGSTLTVYQDNVALLTATDTAYTSGYVCFDPSDQPLSYTHPLVLSSSAGATLTPSVTALTFSSPNSGTTPAPQSFGVASSMPVTFGVSSNMPWLTLALSSSTAPATVTATVNSASLANGTYTANITVVSPGSANTPLVIPVTLSLSSATLAVVPAKLDLFSATGASPAPVMLSVQNLGTGLMPWTAASDSSWMVPSPTSASGPGVLTLAPATSVLSSGNHLATVTVASSGAANGSVAIPVIAHLGASAFSDSFASGSAQWSASPLGLASNWSVVNGSFIYNGKGHTQQYAGNQSWTNYIVSTSMTLSNLSDYPGGLRGRVNLTSGAAYVAWLYPAEHLIKLFKTTTWNTDGGELTLLGQSSTLNFDTAAHMLRLGFSASQIAVYYDNAQVITATDTSLPTGAIALDVSSQPVSFSNVTVLQQ